MVSLSAAENSESNTTVCQGIKSGRLFAAMAPARIIVTKTVAARVTSVINARITRCTSFFNYAAPYLTPELLITTNRNMQTHEPGDEDRQEQLADNRLEIRHGHGNICYG